MHNVDPIKLARLTTLALVLLNLAVVIGPRRVGIKQTTALKVRGERPNVGITEDLIGYERSHRNLETVTAEWVCWFSRPSLSPIRDSGPHRTR